MTHQTTTSISPKLEKKRAHKREKIHKVKAAATESRAAAWNDNREILESSREVTDWCLRNPGMLFLNKWLSFLVVKFPRLANIERVKDFLITPDSLIIKILIERKAKQNELARREQ